MANKTLNFNQLQRPTLELTMMDEAQTVIRVSTPSVGLLEELQAMLPEFEAVARSGNREAIQAIYDMAARLMNCNCSFITVTGEELRTKYAMGLDSMQIFFSAYMDFVNGIYNAKN